MEAGQSLYEIISDCSDVETKLLIAKETYVLQKYERMFIRDRSRDKEKKGAIEPSPVNLFRFKGSTEIETPIVFKDNKKASKKKKGK